MTLVVSFELIFAIHMLVNFILDFKDSSGNIERRLSKISARYLKTSAHIDIIPLIPFQVISLYRNRHCLFYLIKTMRLYSGFKLFDIPKVMEKIKNIYKERAVKFIKQNPSKANDTIQDHNRIEELLTISYTLKILKLVVIILNFSYLTAMMWYILCKFVEDVFMATDYNDPEQAALHTDTFIVNYGLQLKTNYENVVILTYFAFTSLSTVGFGDYAPIGNVERAVGAFVLLGGVAIFSYIMGNFIDILDRFKKFHEELDEGDELTKFFGTMQKFNLGEEFNPEVKHQIEQYFDYRWASDKNIPF